MWTFMYFVLVLFFSYWGISELGQSGTNLFVLNPGPTHIFFNVEETGSNSSVLNTFYSEV